MGGFGQREMKILPGARVEMVPRKKNPTDFALWKFAKERKEMDLGFSLGKGFSRLAHRVCCNVNERIGNSF
jgi:cysteinyl-tRNA synthetase